MKISIVNDFAINSNRRNSRNNSNFVSSINQPNLSYAHPDQLNNRHEYYMGSSSSTRPVPIDYMLAQSSSPNFNQNFHHSRRSRF